MRNGRLVLQLLVLIVLYKLIVAPVNMLQCVLSFGNYCSEPVYNTVYIDT